jgi:hypothetical protein
MALLRALFFLGFTSLPLIAGAAGAEIYKCVGADGREHFTASEADCKGRPAERVQGEVQRTKTDANAPPARSSRPAVQPGQDETQALVWRQKKVKAEQKLARLRQDSGTLEQALAFCEQGGQLRLKDPETGLNEVVPCETVQREATRALQELDELELYLHEGGLEDDCRRSGCLPGWIR